MSNTAAPLLPYERAERPVPIEQKIETALPDDDRAGVTLEGNEIDSTDDAIDELKGKAEEDSDADDEQDDEQDEQDDEEDDGEAEPTYKVIVDGDEIEVPQSELL